MNVTRSESGIASATTKVKLQRRRKRKSTAIARIEPSMPLFQSPWMESVI